MYIYVVIPRAITKKLYIRKDINIQKYRKIEIEFLKKMLIMTAGKGKNARETRKI